MLVCKGSFLSCTDHSVCHLLDQFCTLAKIVTAAVIQDHRWCHYSVIILAEQCWCDIFLASCPESSPPTFFVHDVTKLGRSSETRLTFLLAVKWLFIWTQSDLPWSPNCRFLLIAYKSTLSTCNNTEWPLGHMLPQLNVHMPSLILQMIQPPPSSSTTDLCRIIHLIKRTLRTFVDININMKHVQVSSGT